MTHKHDYPKSLAREGISAIVRCLKLLQPGEKPVENSCLPPLRSILSIPTPRSFFLYAFAFPQVLQDPPEKYFPYFGYIGAIFTKNRTLSTKTVDAARSLPKFLDKKTGEFTPALYEFTYFLKIKNLKF